MILRREKIINTEVEMEVLVQQSFSQIKDGVYTIILTKWKWVKGRANGLQFSCFAGKFVGSTNTVASHSKGLEVFMPYRRVALLPF